jgi:hypothetical protein
MKSGKDRSIAERLDLLESRIQIEEVLHAYARGVDRVDEELWRYCFWPDATSRHADIPECNSQEFITDRLEFRRRSNIKSTRHGISNVSIEIEGDIAFSECYYTSTHRRMNEAGTDEEDYYSHGRYLDRFERRQGVWKIVMRRTLHEFQRTEPRADTSLATADPESVGHLKPHDPYYAMRADFKEIAGKR